MSENNKEGKIPMPTPNFKVDANPGSHVKKMIAVVSGKGGVGKSSVTGMCAMWSVRKGYRTGILDADVTGPSIPKMFGVGPEDVSGTDQVLYPAQTQTGIKIMSMNLLMTDENQPVVWRAPVITGAIKQFWTDVEWGDVDYMFVDMPPGTGDVPLTVMQSIKLDGIIIVTSPQELVSMIVEKAVKMAEAMKVPILGLVENMSYFECPDCGKRNAIYGQSHIEEIAKEYNLDVLGRIPIQPALAAECDAGQIETTEADYLDEATAKLLALDD